MRFFKLCMIISLLGIYIVILGLMILTLFQGHMFARKRKYKFYCLDSCSLLSEQYMVATYIKKTMHSMFWATLVCIQGR